MLERERERERMSAVLFLSETRCEKHLFWRLAFAQTEVSWAIACVANAWVVLAPPTATRTPAAVYARGA